jgi:hypothetical protein
MDRKIWFLWKYFALGKSRCPVETLGYKLLVFTAAGDFTDIFPQVILVTANRILGV